MSKKRVFIPVGHGGSDPGAVANGFKESHMNLTIAKAMGAFLTKYGYVVGYSRTKDEYDPVSQEIRECNAFNADVAASPHINAGGGDGFEAICSVVGTEGRKLAQCIEAQVKAIGQNSRGIKTRRNAAGRDYFGIIRETKCPSIILEGCFIDNKKDLKDFDEEHELKQLGEAYAKGVMDYFGDSSYKAHNGNVAAPSKPQASKPQASKPKPPTGTTSKLVPQKGKCTWNTTVNIREKASTKSKAVGTYKKGQSVFYDHYIDNEGYRWISWIGASGKRRYAAVRVLSNNKRYGTCV